jgi:hypothetical protein
MDLVQNLKEKRGLKVDEISLTPPPPRTSKASSTVVPFAVVRTVHFAGHEVDAGQQADRAAVSVFVIACEGRVRAEFGRQIRYRCCDRLDAGLLVIGE